MKKGIKEAEGFSVEGKDDNLVIDCPDCGTEHEYTGYFDSYDITECWCGCKFNTKKVWLNDKEYIY